MFSQYIVVKLCMNAHCDRKIKGIIKIECNKHTNRKLILLPSIVCYLLCVCVCSSCICLADIYVERIQSNAMNESFHFFLCTDCFCLLRKNQFQTLLSSFTSFLFSLWAPFVSVAFVQISFSALRFRWDIFIHLIL